MARTLTTRIPAPIAVFLAFVLAASMLIGTAAPADASRSTELEQRLTQLVNQARSANGLPALTVRSDLVDVAYRWSTHMASTETLAHNPNYSSQICCWRRVAENVGRASVSSIDDPARLAQRLHDAFMNSPGHRANILSADATEIGIGGVITETNAWVTQNFRLPLETTTTSDTDSTTKEPAKEESTSTTTSSPAPKTTTTTTTSSPTKSTSPKPAPAAASTSDPAPEQEPEEPALSEEELAALRAEIDAQLFVSTPSDLGIYLSQMEGDFFPSHAAMRYSGKLYHASQNSTLTAGDSLQVLNTSEAGTLVLGVRQIAAGGLAGLLLAALIGTGLALRPARR